MSYSSLWFATASTTPYPRLDTDLTVDTVIVGAGITGLTTARQLSAEGQRVAVLEADVIAASSTGNSTGNLYAPVSDQLSQIDRKWDQQVMHQVVQSRRQAVDYIETTAEELAIDCHFVRCPWYLYAPFGDASYQKILQAEYQAALDAGLSATMEQAPPLPYPAGATLRVDGQAQFNPARYAHGLARALHSAGVHLFEHSPVFEIDGHQGMVHTASGRVSASNIVVTTHTPKGVSLLHTELGPYREYGIALKLNGGDYPQGIFWQLGKKRTLRSYDDGGGPYLVVVGEKHKTGQGGDTEQCYQRLEQFARERFDVAELTHRWSAQSYHAADSLPYIGRPHRDEALYIASGFSTDGLVYGTVAGQLIANQIVGRDDPLRELYDPRRFTPAKSAVTFAKENLNNAAQTAKDYVSRGEVNSAAEIPAGEGRLLKSGGERLAVYRDQGGELLALSAVCPHMRCLVHWNTAERSWDCPCHGSRFTREGHVIEGPALDPLERRTLSQ